MGIGVQCKSCRVAPQYGGDDLNSRTILEYMANNSMLKIMGPNLWQSPTPRYTVEFAKDTVQWNRSPEMKRPRNCFLLFSLWFQNPNSIFFQMHKISAFKGSLHIISLFITLFCNISMHIPLLSAEITLLFAC